MDPKSMKYKLSQVVHMMTFKPKRVKFQIILKTRNQKHVPVNGSAHKRSARQTMRSISRNKDTSYDFMEFQYQLLTSHISEESNTNEFR